jgi:ketosteroid isomerase-like protein
MIKIGLLAGCVLCLVGTSSISAGSTRPAQGNDLEVRKFLASFVEAFDNLDWPTFRSCFTADATVFYPEFFPRRVEESQTDASWHRVFDNIRGQSGKAKAPYMDLKPSDVQIQILADVAIVTFHLEHGGTAVGRRTLVLHKEANGWRIVHLHASNVDFGNSR